MADTVNLARVDFTNMNDKINFIVEKDFELKRFSISDIDVGGEISIDLSTGTSSNANPINADTLNGYEFEYFASQNNLDEAIENIDEAIKNIDDTITIRAEEIIGNLDIGPKVELNYSIVGGLEEPAEPTENMIWVQTDEEITGHIFQFSTPSTSIDGLVLFKTVSMGNISFNRLKIDNIEVDIIYLSSALQYYNNTWNNINAQIYQQGKWNNFITDIYNNGTEACPILTATNSNNATATKNINNIILAGVYGTMQVDRYSTCFTQDAIDLTPYSMLIVDGEYSDVSGESSTYKIGISNNIANFSTPNSTNYNTISGTSSNSLGLFSLKFDISKINQLCYIGVYTHIGKTKVNRISLQ